MKMKEDKADQVPVAENGEYADVLNSMKISSAIRRLSVLTISVVFGGGPPRPVISLFDLSELGTDRFESCLPQGYRCSLEIGMVYSSALDE